MTAFPRSGKSQALKNDRKSARNSNSMLFTLHGVFHSFFFLFLLALLSFLSLSRSFPCPVYSSFASLSFLKYAFVCFVRVRTAGVRAYSRRSGGGARGRGRGGPLQSGPITKAAAARTKLGVGGELSLRPRDLIRPHPPRFGGFAPDFSSPHFVSSRFSFRSVFFLSHAYAAPLDSVCNTCSKDFTFFCTMYSSHDVYPTVSSLSPSSSLSLYIHFSFPPPEVFFRPSFVLEPLL